MSTAFNAFMASQPTWSVVCPVTNTPHEQFYSPYAYCGECYTRNPNPPQTTTYRQSSLAPREQPQQVTIPLPTPTYIAQSVAGLGLNPPSAVGPYAAASRQRLNPPPTPGSPVGHTTLASFPSIAKPARRSGFKTRRPPIRHAGTPAISVSSSSTISRPAHQALPPLPIAFEVEVEISVYQQQLTIKLKRGEPPIWTYGEPILYLEWFDVIVDTEFESQTLPLID